MIKVKALSVLLVILLVPAVWPGQISPYLDDYMQGIVASDQIDVIVMLNEQADIRSLNRQLQREGATLAERNRIVIEALQEAASQTQPQVAAYLDELKSDGLIESYRMLWIANMFLVTANKAGIEAIAAMPEIDELFFDYIIENIKPIESDSEPPLTTGHEIGLEKINALAAWAAGFTGAGRVVANIDTGVDGTHPALSARFRGDVDNDGDVDESWYDPYTTNWPFPQDGGSHGTHTMGTICGRTESGSDTIGVAIDAQWIAAGAVDRGGDLNRTIADIILSFEWFVDPDGDVNTQDNPDAVGNSWGISPIFHGVDHCDETFWVVIDNLEYAGTAVIFSAGNEGSYGANSLRTPADRETTPYNCFSVGSVDGGNASLPISGFSSRGPTYCTPGGGEAFKPEVVAPGENVRSSVPNGGYSSYDGTSMASPHITGAVAVIRQANPNLDVESIKEILMNTAVDLGPSGEDNDYGYGIIDLYEACIVAQSGFGFIDGYVYDENTNAIENAIIQVVGTTRTAFTEDNGFYHIGMPADTTYTLIASYFGHLPDSAEVEVFADSTVYQDFTLNFAEFGILNGHITDLDMNPIENAIIRVVGTPLDPAYSNSEGYYIFNNIPGGNNYDIEATASGYGLGRANVFVPVNDTVELDFALQEIESFEANDGNWTGEGCWEWGVPTSGPGNAYDGNNVWATVLAGNYYDDADDGLFTPFYEITEANASFSFNHWYNMERGYSAYDGGNIHITTDGGSSWILVYPEGGYPESEVIGLDGEPGFSGESGGWQQVIVDLSAYESQMVMIKFRFGTDGSIQRDGWYIDGVVLNGGSALFPEANISPSSIRVDIEAGDSTTVPLTISNTGNAQLNFSIGVTTDDQMLSIPPDNNSGNPEISDNDIVKYNVDDLTYYNYVGPKTDKETASGNGLITDFGGPDGFGYTWIDSNEPDGPEYNWIDISGYGNMINDLEDDTNVGPFDIGFEFPFYDNFYYTFNFCSNGFITFTSSSHDYLNDPIPTNGNEPLNLVAPFWDDLDFRDGGEAYYYSTGDSLIISYINVPHHSMEEGGPYTFQIILLADGDIIYQYADINDPEASNTIGIQNEDGSIGLQIVYNDYYAAQDLAVKIKYPLFWLMVSPMSGSVLPDLSTDLDVTFNASGLEDGLYTGQILISTNDPDNGLFTVPCTLHVGYVGVDEALTAVPVSFSLSQNYPNPFNPTTVISFGLPEAGHTSLEIYNIIGRKVKTLVDGKLGAGVHKIIWDSSDESGNSVATGVYFYKLVQGDNITTKKMMMLK